MTKLSWLRVQKNLKQSELAVLIGKSRSTLSLYENAKVTPSYDIILKLKNLLGYYEDDLLTKMEFKKRIVR